MTDHADFSAEAALREVERAQGAVRRAGRRAAMFFLTLWLISTAYWLAALLGPEAVRDYSGLGLFLAVGVVLVARLVFRERVYSRMTARIVYPVTGAFVGTSVLASLYTTFLHPLEPGPQWVVPDVVVTLVAGAPLLYGAVRVLRSENDR
ncbi:hypothetical protein [Nonomuraea roseoviolacea]|uniref:Uncharacterized protein n=1 Tax=Nonomuraea roseoviolacea subsp. carminata TaxID=160689 RepID=A0ABT1KDA4_9ACTN|nr:hypothetical protein [Nonomuraea roseoviolacea]MCP2352010.1 hypothetical protein [Nonomuraea roseoviolacea subsp. carminata]